MRIAGLQMKTFREPNIDTHVDPDELRIQWRSYNRVLEKLVMDEKVELINMRSIDILKNLINPKMELYRYTVESKYSSIYSSFSVA